MRALLNVACDAKAREWPPAAWLRFQAPGGEKRLQYTHTCRKRHNGDMCAREVCGDRELARASEAAGPETTRGSWKDPVRLRTIRTLGVVVENTNQAGADAAAEAGAPAAAPTGGALFLPIIVCSLRPGRPQAEAAPRRESRDAPRTVVEEIVRIPGDVGQERELLHRLPSRPPLP